MGLDKVTYLFTVLICEHIYGKLCEQAWSCDHCGAAWLAALLIPCCFNPLNSAELHWFIQTSVRFEEDIINKVDFQQFSNGMQTLNCILLENCTVRPWSIFESLQRGNCGRAIILLPKIPIQLICVIRTESECSLAVDILPHSPAELVSDLNL